MIIAKTEQIANPEIEECIMRFIPSAKKLSEVSSEISFQLPLNTVGCFKDLFEEIDNNLQNLKINSYGISITTLEEVFLKVAENDILSKDHLAVKQNTLENKDKEYEKLDNFDMASIKVKSKISLFCMHFGALFVKRMNYFKRDKKGILAEIFLPIIIVIMGLAIISRTNFVDIGPLPINSKMYSTPMDVIVSGPVTDTLKKSIINRIQPSSDYSFEYYSSSSLKDWEKYDFSKRKVERKGAYYINESDSTNAVFNYYLLTNTISPDAAALYIKNIELAAIRELANNNNINIEYDNWPLPLTYVVKNLENTADGFAATFIFTIGMSFIPASMIVFIMKEKSLNVKHQQLVSGVSLLAYWTSNYCVDMVIYLIPAIISAFMAKAFNVASLSKGTNWGALWCIYILYGWAIISFTYVSSFLFKDYGNAQLIMFFFCFSFG